MEKVKKSLEALLSMSAGLIDGFTSLTITNIQKVNDSIELHVHYKYYNDIEFDILLRMTNLDGEDILEIHHSSVQFNTVTYHPYFIYNATQETKKNELLLEKIKAVLEFLQRGHEYIQKQFFIAKPKIEENL